MGDRRRVRRLTVAALLCAGCGTTVTAPPGAAPAGGLDLAGPVPAAVDGAAQPLPDGSFPAADVPGPLGSAPVAAGGATAPAAGGSGPRGSRSGPTTAAAARHPVEVGFMHATGVTEFAAALGISAEVGDGKAQATAIVNWVNANGGLNGHPIRPVFYALDLTRTDPYSQFMQEMCSLWTEDHHVVAAFAYANADYTPLARCLSENGAVFTAYSSYARDRNDYRSSPLWVEPATIAAERLAPLQVRTFEGQGFLRGQQRVGLLAYDYPQAQRLTDLLVEQLKARGITTSVYPIRYGGSTPELSGTIASIQNAVLRFRSEGIERVMSAAYPGAMAFFMRYADNQGYRPLYGLSSYDALAALPQNAPTSQLHGAVAVGWWPTADTSTGDTRALNATGRTCRAVFGEAGIPPTQETYSFGYCDVTLSLQAAARAVRSPALTGQHLRAGMLSLGSSYLSPSIYATTLGAGRHDGVAAARPLAYVDDCSCWRPSGPVAQTP